MLRVHTAGASEGTLRDALAGRRVAIVHDWFQGFHGSERTIEAMRATLARAGSAPDVYTFHAARELLPPALAASIRGESRLASLPHLRQRGHDPGRWRLLLPLMPGHFRRLALETYDVVVSSSHAFAVNVRPRADALHLCYCYTPVRYAWLPAVDGRDGLGAAAARPVRAWLRRVDRRAAVRPDAYLAVSNAVRERIRWAYGRDSVILHPPVDVDDFDPSAPKEPGHFLWVHRLVSYKNPRLVIEAFRGLPYRLTMVGVGPLERQLRSDLPRNVELRGWLPRPELAELYASASGFVHAAEEDFGISTVEALAAGTPVVALGRGGALDIVRAGDDGVLLERAEVGPLRAAVEEVARRQWDTSALAARARRFSTASFVERFRAQLEELLAAHDAPA